MNQSIAEFMRSATVAGPASENMISDAELALGVRFSPHYREFLATFGAALCPAFEIAGLFRSTDDDEPPLWSDVVVFTKQMRLGSRGMIPHEYVAISSDGGDYTFYLDSCGSKGGEHPIVVLGPGADTLVVAADFFDFVIRYSSGGQVF